MRLNLAQICEIKSTTRRLYGRDAKICLFGSQLAHPNCKTVNLYIDAGGLSDLERRESLLKRLLRRRLLGNWLIDVIYRDDEASLDIKIAEEIQNGVHL